MPRSQLTLKEVNNTKLYSLDVTGEVLKDDQLFENYRYRFDYPGDIKDDKVAVVIDRFLRPADYMARVRVQDINSGAEAIVEKPITVPEIFDTPEQQKAKESATTALSQLKDDIDSNTTRLRIVPLTDDLLSGIQHIETIAFGDDIKAVEFYLDGKKVMTKRQPPYTLDLDFGNVPQVRRVRAVALDAKGEPITGDEMILNTGNDPFRVRIVSPRDRLQAARPHARRDVGERPRGEEARSRRAVPQRDEAWPRSTARRTCRPSRSRRRKASATSAPWRR